MRAWEMVQQQQPCTNAQVAKALDEKRKRVHQALQALIKQEKVSKDGLHYSVVDASKSKASG
jgi:DNA-binding IclR family transcriptional regulator